MASKKKQILRLPKGTKGGPIIKHARNLRRFSQRELANQYGISENTLQNWEQNKNEPPYCSVMDILDLLGYELQEVCDA